MTDHEIFREITTRVCGTLNLSNALRNVFDFLCDIIPLDEIRVNILDPKIHAVKTILIVDREKESDLLAKPLVLPLPKEVESELAGNALEDVRIAQRIEDDRATEAVRSEYFKQIPQSSLLIVRLVLDGKRLGALLLRAEGEKRYDDRHKHLLSKLIEPFAIAVNNAFAHHRIEHLKNALAEENRFLRSELKVEGGEIIGASFGLSYVMDLVHRVAPLESSVVLLGETGVGKEVIANAIHNNSPRRSGPFIKVNCGAIPESLIDSELFGHEKGAFTGAITRKKGRFELADGGTLFLDEIGELSFGAQVRLLRVLQTNKLERVGGSAPIETDVRIIAATHRDLEKLVHRGDFRQDLWYRINIFPITIPPLRERKADIPALVNHFIEKKSLEMGIQSVPQLAEGAMDVLRNYSWPGNVRELENTVERALILCRGGQLTFDWIYNPVWNTENGDTPNGLRSKRAEKDKKPPQKLDTVMGNHIRYTLEYTKGKVGGHDGAAALLGINPSTLRHRMRKLDIQHGRNKK